jgi:regulator of sigma E protease
MEAFFSSLTHLWFQWVYPILLFVVGLGVVVFVHELGHFLAAKIANIKVERFALGFGKRVLGFQRGETDYCLNLLPLGGYVKMLGQEDVKSVEQIADPRAFSNKSVGVRLGVVAAGVVMNAVFAAVVFVIVAMVGKSYPAPVVGGVVPDFPAAEAVITWQDGRDQPPASEPTTVPTSQPTSKGLRPGDRILDLDSDRLLLRLIGKSITRFSDIAMTAVLAGPDDTFTMTLQRETDGKVRLGKTTLGVKRYPDGSQMAFGISSALDSVVADDPELVSDPARVLRDGDRVTAIDGRPVKHFWEMEDLAGELTGRAVPITVFRDGKELELTLRPVLYTVPEVIWLKDGSVVRGKTISQEDEHVTVRLADGTEKTFPEADIAGGAHREPLDILGLIPRVEAAAVLRGSPADKAGMKPGDIVVGYGEGGAPTLHTLLDLNKQFAGQGTRIVVLRDQQKYSSWIKPAKRNGGAEIGIRPAPDLENVVVGGVRPNSPAAKAGIEPDSVIRAVDDEPVHSWVDLYAALKARTGKEVSLTWQTGANEHRAKLGKLTAAEFGPDDYAFSLWGSQVAFRQLEVTIVKTDPLEALTWGARETGKFILSTCLSLQGLLKGHVSTKNLSGPVGIGQLAVQAGRRSLLDFVYFMAVISAILAVMNFLPIPVVDGGHAVFLIIEKVHGKPLPPRVMYIAQVCGLVFLGAVFIALTWQDIGRLWSGLW